MPQRPSSSPPSPTRTCPPRSAAAACRSCTAASSELGTILGTWLGEHADGIACVISTDDLAAEAFGENSRVSALTPELAKGLEFDLVILIDPDSFGDGIEGAVDRYVAMTRATQQLVVLTS